MNEKSVNKKRILFVCHGNICRSPMAEMVMKEFVRKEGRENEFFIDSAACRMDEIGSFMHRGTRQKLTEMGIPFTEHRARLIQKKDYERFDMIVYMDSENERDLKRFFPSENGKQGGKRKIFRLMEFAGKSRDVADPWYTGNFDETWDDITAGCRGILKNV